MMMAIMMVISMMTTLRRRYFLHFVFTNNTVECNKSRLMLYNRATKTLVWWDLVYQVTAYQKSQLPCRRNEWCLSEGTYRGSVTDIKFTGFKYLYLFIPLTYRIFIRHAELTNNIWYEFLCFGCGFRFPGIWRRVRCDWCQTFPDTATVS
jgi:hypothetical protein